MKLRIAIWHNLPSGGGKRQLYNHVKGLLVRGHYLESWCPETADQKYLPLGNLIKENIIPLETVKDSFYDSIRSEETVRDILRVMNEHCKSCVEEINKKDFDILFVGACMFLRTTPIAKYAGLPSVIYLNEPYRWFYESLPELPWLAPQNSIDDREKLNITQDCVTKQTKLYGIRLQAREELEFAKKFNLILANSVYSRENILRVYNLESKVCYLGIDTDYYQPTGERKEDFVVGLGTIYYGKGIDRAIRAVATIKKEKRPPLIWIGNGASLYDLERYKILADESGVNFIPKIHISDKEVISLLSRAVAMIYTSRLEPFGLAPLEANSCGTAVVAIAEGGVRETIKDGVNGFLANEDNPQILGDLIYRFVDDRSLSYKLGLQAREYVRGNWNMKLCTDNIESCLSQILSRKYKVSFSELISQDARFST